jgi:hypothetical protein
MSTKAMAAGSVDRKERGPLDGVRRRPWWIALLWAFCLYMTCIYMPFDVFFKPVAEDKEVWFGFAVSGWWAKATEPIHWLIYASGAWGFWGMHRWMWPWAALYAGQVAFGMLVWNLADVRGRGWIAGTIAAIVFMIPTIALWRAKPLFVGSRDSRFDS